MSNLVQVEWEKFRETTLQDAPAEFVTETQFFFFAGANVMYSLFMRAPEAELDKLVYFNELQRELLDFIAQPACQGTAAPGSGLD